VDQRPKGDAIHVVLFPSLNLVGFLLGSQSLRAKQILWYSTVTRRCVGHWGLPGGDLGGDGFRAVGTTAPPNAVIGPAGQGLAFSADLRCYYAGAAFNLLEDTLLGTKTFTPLIVGPEQGVSGRSGRSTKLR